MRTNTTVNFPEKRPFTLQIALREITWFKKEGWKTGRNYVRNGYNQAGVTEYISVSRYFYRKGKSRNDERNKF